jgi:uncharacterized protein
MTVDMAGETLKLLPQKAIHWPARSTLLIADPHWGKAAAFRAAGVGVSGEPLAADLARLSGILTSTRSTRLVILGDLFHARTGKSPMVLETLAAWRKNHAEVEMTLVRGNHDRAAGDPPAALGIHCVPEPVAEPPFAFRHFPGETPGLYSLAGHLHPAAVLRGRGRQVLRVPCFHFGAACGVLPAFGGFTGTATVAPAPGDRVIVIADGEVIEVA